MCLAIKRLADKFATNGVRFVYPVHLNPNVRNPVDEILSHTENIDLIEPLDYLPFVQLMKKAEVILTDSGGVQEEAPGLGVPVLVMRNTTERPEGLKTGVVKLISNVGEKIFSETAELLSSPEKRRAMSEAVNPYGDGKAAEKIIQDILEY
jgi:UDP-N-acetylglucosamine 2-epimerase (non-hydrolysing)